MKFVLLIQFACLSLVGAQTLIPQSAIQSVNDYGANNKFIIDPENDGSFYTLFKFGVMNELQVDGIGRVYSFCSQFHINGANGDVLLTSGISQLGSPRSEQINALLSNGMQGFFNLRQSYLILQPDGQYNALFDNEWQMMHGYANGLQDAVWEINEELSGTLGIGNDQPSPGNFQVQTNRYPLGSAERYGADYAIEFIGKINDGTWTANPSAPLYYADSGADQDHIWYAVPEPSALLLGLASAGLFLRRRR